MNDVAVLLNLTSKLNFEVTDPLLNVVCADVPLLFYDQLSIEKFPTDADQCCSHIESVASSLRNMLEARSLSEDDHNEAIRLIVVLDFADGAFLPKGHPKKCFPAQKARLFKNMLVNAFGECNTLLKRIEYCFVFLTDSTNLQTNNFYMPLSYDGLTGVNADEWIGRSTLCVNDKRNKALEGLKSPDDETPLSSNTVKHAYEEFNDFLRSVLETISRRMEEASIADFEKIFLEKTDGIVTIGDFTRFDYDATLAWCISQLIGLNAEDFHDNCTFFIIPFDRTNVTIRRKNELFIASLVQFLSTISPEDYAQRFKPDVTNVSARLFVTGESNQDDLDQVAYGTLEQMVHTCLPQIERTRWKLDQKVKYKQYKAKVEDPQAVDSHRQLNDMFAQQRQEMYDTFLKTRKTPFFFGNRIGDWAWYNNVIKCAENIYHFETINDRPLYDPPMRITDKEMDSIELESSYAELQNELNVIPKVTPVIKKGIDLNVYLEERRRLMTDFGTAVEDLRKEMVKLGFFICILWIGIFSALGFTLCHAYHFFWFNNEDPLWLIAAGFGVAALLFVLSAVIGQASVRSKIKAVHKRMDQAFYKMQSNLQEYLDDVNERVKLQQEADILRRNIDEMKAKMTEFDRHNKQIDLWISFFQGIATKLATTIHLLKIQRNEDKASVKDKDYDLNDGCLDGVMPALPKSIREIFEDRTVLFGNQRIPVHHVTSFMSHFRFSEEGL